MNQMTTFILLFCGLGLLFYVMGLNETSNDLVDLLLYPVDLDSSELWTVGIIEIAAFGAAFVLGFFTKNIELAFMVVFMPQLASLLWNFVSVIGIVASYYPIIAVLVFGPLSVLFMVTLIDYWRGRD